MEATITKKPRQKYATFEEYEEANRTRARARYWEKLKQDHPLPRGRPPKYETEEERREALLASKRKYAHKHYHHLLKE